MAVMADLTIFMTCSRPTHHASLCFWLCVALPTNALTTGVSSGASPSHMCFSSDASALRLALVPGRLGRFLFFQLLLTPTLYANCQHASKQCTENYVVETLTARLGWKSIWVGAAPGADGFCLRPRLFGVPGGRPLPRR